VKKNVMRWASLVTGNLVDAVDSACRSFFINENRIELEACALLGTIARYREQTDPWLAATKTVNSVLRCVTLVLPYILLSIHII
jgi:hypothetical protein